MTTTALRVVYQPVTVDLVDQSATYHAEESVDLVEFREEGGEDRGYDCRGYRRGRVHHGSCVCSPGACSVRLRRQLRAVRGGERVMTVIFETPTGQPDVSAAYAVRDALLENGYDRDDVTVRVSNDAFDLEVNR